MTKILDQWVSIKKKVPNTKTRYAGKYAVTVLGYEKCESTPALVANGGC